MRAAGQLLVDGFQRCGANMHNHFAVARDGLGELFIAGWFSKRVQHGSIHRLSPRDGVGVCLLYDSSETGLLALSLYVTSNDHFDFSPDLNKSEEPFPFRTKPQK